MNLTKIFENNYYFVSILGKNFEYSAKKSFAESSIYWPKFPFLTTISIFDQYFWSKSNFSIFDQNYIFFIKNSIFDQNSGFWPKFRFLTKISIFDPKIRVFHQNFYFWPKFRFLTKVSIFFPKFLAKIFIFQNMTSHDYYFWKFR